MDNTFTCFICGKQNINEYAGVWKLWNSRRTSEKTKSHVKICRLCNNDMAIAKNTGALQHIMFTGSWGFDTYSQWVAFKAA